MLIKIYLVPDYFILNQVYMIYANYISLYFTDIQTH